jgi:hypothetical protein
MLDATKENVLLVCSLIVLVLRRSSEVPHRGLDAKTLSAQEMSM